MKTLMETPRKQTEIRKRTTADEKTGMHLYRQLHQIACSGTLLKNNTIAIIK